jgi:hypothetical protein
MSERASTILVEMEADIDDYLEHLGSDGLKRHFADAGQRAFDRHGNTIESAAYFAAAANDDYCSGAYKN